jgi:hypothetical protein
MLHLTKQDIGKKFKTRSGEVVELKDNGSGMYPFFISPKGCPFHGLDDTGESCVDWKAFDLVERVVEEEKAEKKTPLEPGMSFTKNGMTLNAFQFAAHKYVLCNVNLATYNRWTDDVFTTVEQVEKFLGIERVKVGDKVTCTDAHGWACLEVGGVYTVLAIDAAGKYKLSGKPQALDHIGWAPKYFRKSTKEEIEAAEKVKMLPVGTFIKFVRNSRSGRYKKGDLAQVVDHGQRSMCVHKIGSSEGIFLPPDRADIYTVVTV